MSLSNAELAKKLRDLLSVMLARLPADKKLSPAVVQQLLRTKYASTYPEAYIAANEAFITETINTIAAERAAAADAKKAAETTKVSESDDDDDDDDDEDDEDDEEDGSDEEGEESGSGEGEDDEDEDEDDFESSSDDDDDGDDEKEAERDGEPEAKKARQEEENAIQAKSSSQGNNNARNGCGGEDVAERCKAMVACLKKLSYRVRGPTDSESLEEYLNSYLVDEFTKHKMDPARYGKNDIKQYKIRREVELLQQDGASLNLDRRNRVGRGYAGVNADGSHDNGGENVSAGPSAYKTSVFLDDEE